MDFVTSFAFMLQQVAFTMTRPTFRNFVDLLVGWTFAPRRTVTGMINAASLHDRHHSIFHRVFSKATWSLDFVGLAVFNLFQPFLGKHVIWLVLDDTLARKRGKKVYGAGMHHDPLISSRNCKLVNWGHNWIVLCVLIRFPLWPNRPFALPVLFRLYLNEGTSAKLERVHRTRPELAVELLKKLCEWCPRRQFHVLADSTYGGKSVLKNLPKNCDLTSRLKLNAWIFDEPPMQQGQRGRKRIKGGRLPSPNEMLKQRAKRKTIKIYGRKESVRICDCRGRLRHVPTRPVRVVAVESLKGKRRCEAFYSTNVNAKAVQILTWYSWRWSIEVMFHDTKTYLGFEQPQGWTRKAVERTAPIAMLLYSMIVIWFVQYGYRSYRPVQNSWYRKQHASFSDMLSTLRVASVREKLFALSPKTLDSQKIIETLESFVQLAA
jgi:FOG: Transposase